MPLIGPFVARTPVVLASASPRRRELLANLGLDFAVLPSHAPEPAPEPGEPPQDYAMRTARLKTMETAAGGAQGVILGADTVVALESAPAGGSQGRPPVWRIMGKPADAAEALDMLQALSGQTHLVTTGCCLLAPGGSPELFAVSARVTMRRSTDRELAAYVATGEPMDKAGAYAIQGQGAFLVSSVQGSTTAVIGLPVTEVLERLLALGAVRPAP